MKYYKISDLPLVPETVGLQLIVKNRTITHPTSPVVLLGDVFSELMLEDKYGKYAPNFAIRGNFNSVYGVKNVFTYNPKSGDCIMYITGIENDYDIFPYLITPKDDIHHRLVFHHTYREPGRNVKVLTQIIQRIKI